MRTILKGSFKSLHEDTIFVQISSNIPGASLNYTTGDYLDQNHNFCFVGKNPVVIEHKCKDLFEPIISCNCKIKLRTNIWCGDILYSQGLGDMMVRVTRRREGQSVHQAELLFIGYVKPMTFNQDINKKDNEITLNCIDILTYLESKQISSLYDSYNNAYEEALKNAGYRTFIDYFQSMGLYGAEYEFESEDGLSYETYESDLLIDNTEYTVFHNLSLSDNLWLGDSADSEKNYQDILIEMLKYLNSRIISVNGLNCYIIDNRNYMRNDGFSFYDCVVGDSSEENAVPPSLVSNVPDENKAKEQVSIDDVYNKIGVKCNLENIDDVVTSPLDEDTLYSDYKNKQKFMTEMAANNASNLFKLMKNHGMPLDGSITNTDCWTRDWYLRVMKSAAWKSSNNFDNNNIRFNSGKAGDTRNSILYYNTTGADGKRINQMKAIYDLGKQRQGTQWTLDERFGAYILQIGSGDKRSIKSTKPDGNITMTPYLVIPINGMVTDWDTPSTYPNTQTTFPDYNPSNTEKQLYETDAQGQWQDILQNSNTVNGAMITYEAGTTVNFTPPDNQTTNYIVISGKLTLEPIWKYQKSYTTEKNNINAISNLVNSNYTDAEAHVDRDHEVTAWTDEKCKYYYRHFWDCTEVNSEQYVSSPVCALECWYPHVDNDNLKDFKYKGSVARNSIEEDDTLTNNDMLSFVPVLCCQLSVGDNYCLQLINADSTYSFVWINEQNKSDYGISDITTCAITIGIDPDVDDYIIGKSWETASNISPSMNINASGMAIPINYGDNVSGKINFKILGPYNTTWLNPVKTKHHSLKFICCVPSSAFPLTAGVVPLHWAVPIYWPKTIVTYDDYYYSLLNHVKSIIIEKFEVKAMSDNAKNATLNESDLMYYSQDDKTFKNEKTDITFDIVTALTTTKAQELNVAVGVSYNNPTYLDGNLYAPTVTQEETYIRTMYNLYCLPKKIIDYQCDYADTNISSLYQSVMNCNLMNDLSVADFYTILIGDKIDLKNDRINLTIREI